jgi:hypothetical protein
MERILAWIASFLSGNRAEQLLRFHAKGGRDIGRWRLLIPDGRSQHYPHNKNYAQETTISVLAN